MITGDFEVAKIAVGPGSYEPKPLARGYAK